MSRSPQTAARRYMTSALRREVHVQLDKARFGVQRREPVQSRRTVGGVHVTTESR